MVERLVGQESPIEFFKEQLEKAMDHQRISTSSFTAYYLVKLLSDCVSSAALPAREPGFDETPLALLYIRAMQASRHERARLLQALGDMALFVSGYFGDSLQLRRHDLGYYRRLGGDAYARLRHQDQLLGFGPEVFGELADRFTEFTDLLAEVSEATRGHSDASVLQLYERWMMTRSSRVARHLAAKGITPVLPGDPSRLH